jgi:CBS domain-containing protein
MICPACYHDNLPGDEACRECGQSLTFLDMPVGGNRVERSLLEDQVKVLKPRAPVTVCASTTVRQAISTMLAHDIGALLVVDEAGKLTGIFSERDLLTKVVGTSPAACSQTVGEVMTARPETVTGEDKLAFALHKMDVRGYRHLPVVEGDKPVGVISVRDMLRHITRLCDNR